MHFSVYYDLAFLPHYAMLARCMLSSCVRLSVRLSVCVTSRYCTRLNAGSRKRRHTRVTFRAVWRMLICAIYKYCYLLTYLLTWPYLIVELCHIFWVGEDRHFKFSLCRLILRNSDGVTPTEAPNAIGGHAKIQLRIFLRLRRLTAENMCDWLCP